MKISHKGTKAQRRKGIFRSKHTKAQRRKKIFGIGELQSIPKIIFSQENRLAY
jgi:hypothetical protein